jgi:hypothetical protein
MAIFKKKKIQIEPDYKTWEDDFGFLSLILKRKKGITKEFLINIYSSQKSDKDYLSDEEINPIVERIILETMEQIGEEYQNFLIKKFLYSTLFFN